jgi:hypothetical protein
VLVELKDSHLLSNILKNIQHIDELLGHVLFSEDKYLSIDGGFLPLQAEVMTDALAG